MLTKEQLKKILEEQRDSILKKKLGVERILLDGIENKRKLPHIVVITGIRRSGKSTLLRQIIKRYYKDEDFYYINFEDERLFDFKAENFNDIYESLLELFGEKKTFFIDEIQNIANFENFVRRFYDNGFKFFITGSNAKLLSKELGTKLTGRHVDIVVRPFSFLEFLKMREFEFDKKMLYKTETIVKLKKYFLEYVSKGGMPEYLIYDDKEILARIYEDIVTKDIIVRGGVDNPRQLKELYQYLVNNFSNRFSFNSLKKIINFGSVNTIKKYIEYLEESYFAKVINKFDYSIKKQLVNEKKLYVIDNGFITTLITKFTKDKGWALENLVFNVLKCDFEVFYYSNKQECDFIISENKRIKSAIQVCWELTESNREREVRGLLGAIESFKLNEGLILTYDQEDEMTIEKKKIVVKPVWKWLLEGLNDKERG